MLPETGKVLPKRSGTRARGGEYAATLAAALRDDLGGSHRAIKTIMGWTGASERTVRNWLSGVTGPSGEHLILLARHSDLVFEVFLFMAERDRMLATARLVNARDTLEEVVKMIDGILGRSISDPA